MTTSGTTTFTVTRDDLIAASLRKLQVYGSGVAIPSQDITDCAFALNMWVKAIAKKGLLIWCVSDLVLPTVAGIATYPIGETAAYLYSFAITNVGSGGTPGTYALTITGGGGSGATGTYTIAANGTLGSIIITAGGNSFTSAPALSFSSGSLVGAAATAVIVGLTTPRPMRITDAYLKDQYGNSTTLIIESRSDYNSQGSKTTQGTPNQLFYDPQLANGIVTMLSVPSDSLSSLILTSQRQAMDFNLATDNPDFPQEFYQAIVYGLADVISLDYEVKASVRQEIKLEAARFLADSVNFEQEQTSVRFQPRFQ